MSDQEPANLREEVSDFKKQHPLSQILIGLLIISVSTAVWLGLQWYSLRGELASAREELRTQGLELQDVRQHLEAQRVINRRQAEMLRAANETPSQPQNTP